MRSEVFDRGKPIPLPPSEVDTSKSLLQCQDIESIQSAQSFESSVTVVDRSSSIDEASDRDQEIFLQYTRQSQDHIESVQNAYGFDSSFKLVVRSSSLDKEYEAFGNIFLLYIQQSQNYIESVQNVQNAHGIDSSLVASASSPERENKASDEGQVWPSQIIESVKKTLSQRYHFGFGFFLLAFCLKFVYSIGRKVPPKERFILAFTIRESIGVQRGAAPPLDFFAIRHLSSKLWTMESDIWADLLIICRWANPTTTKEDVLCNLCNEIWIDPHTTSCGHTFCLRCIVEHMERENPTACPKCECYIKREIYPNEVSEILLRIYKNERRPSDDILKKYLPSDLGKRQRKEEVYESTTKKPKLHSEKCEPETASGQLSKTPEKKLSTLKVSFKDLCDRFNLAMEDFNQEISDNHILDIYPQLENWERVAAQLGFSESDLQDIRHKAMLDVKLMKMYMLQQWKSRGLANYNTYQVLIEALWKCECTATVKLVCELLVSGI